MWYPCSLSYIINTDLISPGSSLDTWPINSFWGPGARVGHSAQSSITTLTQPLFYAYKKTVPIILKVKFKINKLGGPVAKGVMVFSEFNDLNKSIQLPYELCFNVISANLLTVIAALRLANTTGINNLRLGRSPIWFSRNPPSSPPASPPHCVARLIIHHNLWEQRYARSKISRGTCFGGGGRRIVQSPPQL